MTGPPEKKLARQYATMDTSRPTDPSTHIRGQTSLARTVYEWHLYDRPGQGMKVKVLTRTMDCPAGTGEQSPPLIR